MEQSSCRLEIRQFTCKNTAVRFMTKQLQQQQMSIKSNMPD